jgi:hypothetical protein
MYASPVSIQWDGYYSHSAFKSLSATGWQPSNLNVAALRTGFKAQNGDFLEKKLQF